MSEEEFILKKQIAENNFTITKLLSENEMLIKKLGYLPPMININIEKEKRFRVPSGYIRTSREFIQKYHLDTLIKNQNVRKNISYSLQLSDWYNFFINRLLIWGSVETSIYKYSFMNLMSIYEALLYEFVDSVRTRCRKCSDIKNCCFNITKKDKSNIKDLIYKLNELNILEYTDEEVVRINEMIDLRNKIHIRLNNENEFTSSQFNIYLHNEAILLISNLAEVLYRKCSKYYNNCSKAINDKTMANL